MELREKIKNAFRRTFMPQAYKRDELFKVLPSEQRGSLDELQKASAKYQEVYDSKSGFEHLADPSDLRNATIGVMVQHQNCQDEGVPQLLIDYYTTPLLLSLLKKMGDTRVIPVGQGMAS